MKRTMGLLSAQPTVTWFRVSRLSERPPCLYLVSLYFKNPKD